MAHDALITVTFAAALLAPGGAMLAALGSRAALPSPWLALPLASILSLVALTVGLLGAFATGRPLRHVVAALALGTLACTVLALLRLRGYVRGRRRRRRAPLPAWRPDLPAALVLAAVACAALLGWCVQGALYSDSLYHVAQAVKLAELPHISLDNTLQFKHGSAHPGYLVPTFQALIAVPSLAFDALRVAQLLPIVTLPVAVLAAAGMAHAVVGTRRAAAVGAWAWIAVLLLGAGASFKPATQASYGGIYVLHVVVPVVVALVVAALADPARIRLAAIALAVALVGVLHVSYLVHLGLPMLALALGWLWTRPGTLPRARRMLLVLGTVLVAAAIVFAVLQPHLKDLQTFLQDSGDVQMPGEGAIQRRETDSDAVRAMLVGGEDRFRLRADLVVASGGVAFVALVLAIIGGIVERRRPAGWLALGGTALVLASVLVPDAFTQLSAAMGIDQARRLVDAVPWVLGIVVGVEALARALGGWGSWSAQRRQAVGSAVALASVGACIAVLAVPRATGRGADAAVDEWSVFALAALAIGAVVVLLVAALVRTVRSAARRATEPADSPRVSIWEEHAPAPGLGAIAPRASLLLALPVVLLVGATTASAWSPLRTERARHAQGLRQGELDWIGPRERAALRAIPQRSIVMTDIFRRTAFRIMAVTPVYVFGAPPGHVANTKQNAIAIRNHRVTYLLESDVSDERRRQLLDGWHVDVVVLRHLPRYADDLASMRGPLADEWRERADTPGLSVFERID